MRKNSCRLSVVSCQWTIALVGIVLVSLATPVLGYLPARTIATDGRVVVRKWANSSLPIVWRMNPTRGSNVTGARELGDVFRLSFQAWQSVSTAAVSFSQGQATDASVKGGFDQINVISTNVAPADYATDALGLTLGFSFDGAGVDQFGRTIEFAGQIIEADILFNPTVTFSTETTTPSNRIDLQSVATHEVGHLLGLDHTNFVSATMFPTLIEGASFARVLTLDDAIGVSTLYPSAAFATRGSISGTVRTTANAPVFGAIVVAVNANGQPVASTITDPDGRYTIAGLDAGSYTVFAEPLDQPATADSFFTLARVFPGRTANTNFTTRFR